MSRTLYQITYNSDSTEGRGAKVDMNVYFTENNDALEFVRSEYYANKYGVMGTPGSQYDIKSVDEETLIPKIYESVEDFEKETGVSVISEEMIQLNKRKAELLKLSNEELVLQLLEKEFK